MDPLTGYPFTAVPIVNGTAAGLHNLGDACSSRKGVPQSRFANESAAVGLWTVGGGGGGGTMTPTSFSDHFPRVSQLHPTPHTRWAVFYLVPRLTAC